MRRKERERDIHFANEVLDKCEFAVLATINPDNTPYCIPVSIVRENDILYFHCALEGQKVINMKANPSVCLTAAADITTPVNLFTIGYQSAVVKGTASEVIEKNEKIHALRLICKRYVPENMAQFDKAIQKSLDHTGIWKIVMDEITGKEKKLKNQ